MSENESDPIRAWRDVHRDFQATSLEAAGHDVTVIKTRHSRSVVLDLARLGYQYRGALYEFILKTTVINDDPTVDGIVDSIYRVTLRDLADLLGRPNMGAIKELIDFPSSDSMEEVLDHLEFPHIDQLANLCKDHCVGIYMHLLQQFDPVNGANYILVQAGMDYLALNEYVPVSATVLHRAHLTNHPEINSDQSGDGILTVPSLTIPSVFANRPGTPCIEPITSTLMYAMDNVDRDTTSAPYKLGRKNFLRHES